MNMSIAQYRAVQNRVVKAHQELALAETVLKNFEADLRSRVQMHVGGGNTIWLVFEGRALKCVKNMHNRYNIKENNKVIVSDYLDGGIRDIRLALAIGEM